MSLFYRSSRGLVMDGVVKAARVSLLLLVIFQILNVIEALGDGKLYLIDMITDSGKDAFRPSEGMSSQDYLIFAVITFNALFLCGTREHVRTTQIPEEVAVRLVQDKKKVEKKAADAVKKAEKAEKKAEEAEKKAEESSSEDEDDFDDFLDDLVVDFVVVFVAEGILFYTL